MYGYVIWGDRPVLTRQQMAGVWFTVAVVPQKGFLARYRRRHPDAVVITDTEREALEAEWAKQDAAEIAVYGSCLSPVNESKGDKKP